MKIISRKAELSDDFPSVPGLSTKQNKGNLNRSKQNKGNLNRSKNKGNLLVSFTNCRSRVLVLGRDVEFDILASVV